MAFGLSKILLFYLSGVSDRAKSRMSRASSFDTSPADSPIKKPAEAPPSQRNHEEQTPKSSNPASKSSFFASLDWQKEEEGGKPAPQPTELEVGLLDDNSDDETDFANFSQQRNNDSVPQGYGLMSDEPSKERETASSKPERNFFDAQLDEQNVNSSSQPEVVDLLNMNSTKPVSTQSVTEGVDLLNIGAHPSNVDLLSGHSSGESTFKSGNDPEPDLLSASNQESTFDPFQQFSQTRSAGPSTQPDLMSSSNPPASNDTFDPFQNFSTPKQPSKSNITVTPPQQNKSGGLDDDFFAFMENTSSSKNRNEEQDLMTSWDTNSIQNFSQSPSHSASNNLKPMAGGIHKSASTGSAMNFQSMMGGQNSSFSSMSGRNSPSMSNGMGMSSGAGMGNIGAVPKVDPFANLGESLATYITFMFIFFSFKYTDSLKKSISVHQSCLVHLRENPLFDSVKKQCMYIYDQDVLPEVSLFLSERCQ